MLMRFDFLKKPIVFENPIKIITTKKANKILDKFKEIEQALNNGYYIAGYISYEASAGLHPFYTTNEATDFPLIYFGVFNKPSKNVPILPEPKIPSLKWNLDIDYKRYKNKIKKIHEQIKFGNTYQVNYTNRFKNICDIEPLSFYAHLLNAQKSKYSAFLDIGRFKILSASPELFFCWEKNELTTKPMKGTIERGLFYEDDLLKQKILKKSLKDKAENVMIVDLLRNDLGIVSIPGSVKTKKLFNIEKYPTLWQMTSTIKSKTLANTTITDIFKALFPCGSITGAPKSKTMNIISELENEPRNIYCGSIGYITPNKKAIFNVAIRTVQIDTTTKEMVYGSGGGITLESNPKDEYKELISKSKVLNNPQPYFELLESILLKNKTYPFLALHMERLRKSCKYFNFPFLYEEIVEKLMEISLNLNQSKEYKIRLTLNSHGKYHISIEEIFSSTQQISTKLATYSQNSKNIFLYYKTTFREHYPPSTPKNEILLYNEKDEITEFTRGNVVFLIDNQLVTPPIYCGLLPGVMREYLLKNKKIIEKVVKINELNKVEKVIFINSIRGWNEINKTF